MAGLFVKSKQRTLKINTKREINSENLPKQEMEADHITLTYRIKNLNYYHQF